MAWNEADEQRRMDAQDVRRERADERAYARLSRRMDAAEPLIGELCKEGRQVFYINLKTRKGVPTGKILEGSRHDLIAYLLRNNYV